MKQYKSIQVQSIGWADMVITEDHRDPNDYRMGSHDPYNTDDDVVDDLFDQWLQSQGEDVSHGAPGEEMQLAFELGAQLAMTKSYHRENGRSYQVNRQFDEQYNDAAIASLTDLGLDSENESIFDAFDAGYRALSSSDTPMIDKTPVHNLHDKEDPLAKLARGMSNHFHKA